MAETVTIEGQQYLKRNPLGVLGLTVITFGIYYFYWYYQVNDELRRFEHDKTISPVRSLMAVLFGWIIIVPPFIAMYNTAKHLQGVEQRMAIQPQLEPALVIVIMLFIAIANGVYIQEHLNRVWDRAASTGTAALPLPGAPQGPLPSPPPAG
jgi:H+/Cl- antiporter ClcA